MHSLWLVFTLPALLLVFCAELGFRLGFRAHAADDAAPTNTVGGVQGAVLGLLGLLLGFTFAMAAGRYDARRELVLKEANAIGTTYLRASLLPATHVAPVEELLRRYVALRVEFQPLADDPDRLAEGLRRSAAIQGELWRHAVAAGAEAPTAMVAAFIDALNDTIDTEAERLAAARARIPLSIWILLLAVAAVGCLTSAYVAGLEGRRSAFSSLALPLLIAVVIVLIFDLMTPRQGFIGISSQPLVDLQQSIGTPGG